MRVTISKIIGRGYGSVRPIADYDLAQTALADQALQKAINDRSVVAAGSYIVLCDDEDRSIVALYVFDVEGGGLRIAQS